MEHANLQLLAWDFPRVETQTVRTLLKPYTLSHSELTALVPVNEQTNRLLLHPRIQTADDLPADVVAACRALGAKSGVHTIENLAPTIVEQLWTVVFFSGSKPITPLRPGLPDTWRRVLSNFHPTTLRIEGKSYPSVEHYFQSQKALSSSRPEMANWFALDYAGVEAVGSEASAAKQAGSKKAYRQHNATLDIADWEAQRVDCMRIAMQHRYKQDDLFREVLDSTRGMKLLHFERAGARSFWGGNFARADGRAVGQNQLGVLLMHLRDS